MACRPGDAEPIKRLKREMSVALGEEDYATAARIRDHPYVQLYLSINEALRKKDIEVSTQRSACEPTRHMLNVRLALVAPCSRWATGEHPGPQLALRNQSGCCAPYHVSWARSSLCQTLTLLNCRAQAARELSAELTKVMDAASGGPSEAESQSAEKQ